MFSKRPQLVISEPDVEAALEHLASLPYRNSLPNSWDRHHLLTMIRESIGSRPKVGQTFDIAPGIYGIIKPFGVDLVSQGKVDGRLQVWLAMRRVGTDPERVTVIRDEQLTFL